MRKSIPLIALAALLVAPTAFAQSTGQEEKSEQSSLYAGQQIRGGPAEGSLKLDHQSSKINVSQFSPALSFTNEGGADFYPFLSSIDHGDVDPTALPSAA
jgi:hypothetical protein